MKTLKQQQDEIRDLFMAQLPKEFTDSLVIVGTNEYSLPIEYDGIKVFVNFKPIVKNFKESDTKDIYNAYDEKTAYDIDCEIKAKEKAEKDRAKQAKIEKDKKRREELKKKKEEKEQKEGKGE